MSNKIDEIYCILYCTDSVLNDRMVAPANEIVRNVFWLVIDCVSIFAIQIGIPSSTSSSTASAFFLRFFVSLSHSLCC